jgi:hypothetical protein
MMQLGGLYPRGVMNKLITSPTPCGVIYPVVALEMWAVRSSSQHQLG